MKISKSQPKADTLVKVLSFCKKEGWFVMVEHEISEDVLKEHGKVLSETNPDIFPIFSGQLVQKVRDIFGL